MDGWKQTRKEYEIDAGGKEIPRKVTYDAKDDAKFLSKNKDVIDIVFRIIGLATIALAIIGYVNTESGKTAAANAKRKQDSVDYAKYLVQLHYQDTNLNARYQELAEATMSHNEDMHQRDSALNRTLASALQNIYLQNKLDLKSRRAEFQNGVFINAYHALEALSTEPVTTEKYQTLWTDIEKNINPELRLINNAAILTTFDTLRIYLRFNGYVERAKRDMDTLSFFLEKVLTSYATGRDFSWRIRPNNIMNLTKLDKYIDNLKHYDDSLDHELRTFVRLPEWYHFEDSAISDNDLFYKTGNNFSEFSGQVVEALKKLKSLQETNNFTEVFLEPTIIHRPRPMTSHIGNPKFEYLTNYGEVINDLELTYRNKIINLKDTLLKQMISANPILGSGQ